MWPGFSGSHQAGRQHAVSRQRVCLGSGGVGLAAVPCLPLTAALLSRLSDTTSRLHSCDLGVAVGCSACWLWSGVELTECAPGFSGGLGLPWLRKGSGVLPSFGVFFSLPFALLGGERLHPLQAFHRTDRQQVPSVMRARHHTL